ncbi:Protein N-acetyltransferase, RimJ/RimL family [Jannaschia faecimaris]|uniref:Protein N-acetyltransferase, RimJ/RimL family n=1 Tax=Jannaschia faecimaris TaxID=1244108 RepID=A0A1H3T640_9RHOB|nr:GNAT family protein [Jannaschia faecimaris]SDZ45348.1 Protein N-acetyltransferase, RimJ/RimL family [Jannaschia faecimaris]
MPHSSPIPVGTEPLTMAGPRVHLRAPTDRDAAARMELGYDPTILRAYGVQMAEKAAYTPERAQSWLKEQREACAWMITVAGELIGTVRLHSHVVADRRAQIAIGLLDSERLGQGLGTEALRLVIDHGFDGLGLHRLSLRVLADNNRAIRCYTKLGFVEEGRERQSARVPGGWQDDLIMGLLADDWTAAGQEG